MSTDKLNVINKPWYSEGLHFKCTECGGCCTGFPGFVWVTEKDIEAIAAYLNISSEECFEKYIRRFGGRLSLDEEDETYACVFLEGKRCSIYPVRPKQCRTFPWWSDNLKSPEAWRDAAHHCEGINHPDGELIPYETIQEHLDK